MRIYALDKNRYVVIMDNVETFECTNPHTGTYLGINAAGNNWINISNLSVNDYHECIKKSFETGYLDLTGTISVAELKTNDLLDKANDAFESGKEFYDNFTACCCDERIDINISQNYNENLRVKIQEQ